jgi:hypothetical protein
MVKTTRSSEPLDLYRFRADRGGFGRYKPWLGGGEVAARKLLSPRIAHLLDVRGQRSQRQLMIELSDEDGRERLVAIYVHNRG